MKLLAHIVTSGRFDLFTRCYQSVVEAMTKDVFVSIVVNGNLPETVQWLRDNPAPRVNWAQVARESRASARNRAFENEDCDLIHFLDDDVVVPPHLFCAVFTRFRALPELAVLGGPNLTPEDSRLPEKLFGAVMTSPFAAPLVRSRYTASQNAEFFATELNLILCNLVIRRSHLPESLRFRENLKSNEENLFLYECRKLDLQCRYSSEVWVHHRRRASLTEFSRQVSSYGHGRAQQTLARPRSCHPAFLVPALACAALLGAWHWPIPSALLLAGYATLSLGAGFFSAEIRRHRVLGLLSMVVLTPLVHISYGLGFWRGIFTELLDRKRDQTIAQFLPSAFVSIDTAESTGVGYP